MPQVIYLIALENILDNAIFDNQIKKLLIRIRQDSGRAGNLTLVCLLPWIEVTRRGVYSNFTRSRARLEDLRLELESLGIELVVRRAFVPGAFFYMGPLRLAWFTLTSLPALVSLIVSRRVEVVHCRYYYAAFLALCARRLPGLKFKVIFDVRTLLPEQGVVNGHWSLGGTAFRCWKRIERRMFAAADRVVSVSPAMTERIVAENPGLAVETIPNFVDLELFRPDPQVRERKRAELGLDNRRVLVFSGTLGGRYPGERIAESVRVFFSLFGQESFFLLLSSSDEKRIAPLAAALDSQGLKSGADWRCLSLPSAEVPACLNAADWSLLVLADFLTSETFLPLKFGEYLALGLPILTHPANRALAGLAGSLGVGAALDPQVPPGELKDRLLSDESSMRSRCLETARGDFSLERFARRYAGIYGDLTGRDSIAEAG
jgi:glycosyltransferase involved in cell wall biosynthesis